MSPLLKAISILMMLVAFVGCVELSFAVVGGYRIASGAVTPGQPMDLDELAPSVKAVVNQLLLGAGLIVLSLIARAAIRRKLLANAA